MTVTATQLHGMLLEATELALVDVREEGDFGRCHPLLAINLPLSSLELRVAALLPRRQVPVVVCDADGAGPARRGAARLAELGYTQVDVLEGGTRAWQEAGYETYSGVNVASKAFGEFVEHACSTPSISAEELKQRMDAGANMVVLDSRPLGEYRDMNIPGSTCVPGGELVYRMAAIAPDPATEVVVNCAGRTRSIIGAQSLINARITNPVVALRNGTMGWHLAGFELERGQSRYLASLDAASTEAAKRLARDVAARYGVRQVDHQTLARWRREGDRSVYLLDVRTPEEFVRGHLPGATNAPGGQLVQATDRYVGVLRSRVVLADDDGVRATMAASWLAQMGLHEVYVLGGRISEATMVRGDTRPQVLGIEHVQASPITPAELDAARRDGEVAVLDLAPSLEFRGGHIPGALHAVRGHLAERMGELPRHGLLVLTCGDGLRARFAAAEAAALTGAEVKVLEGGNAAWRDAGLPMAQGRDGLEAVPRDVYLRPYDHDRSIEQHMQSYLDWEIELLDRLARDDTVRFSVSPAAGG
jgi:rhodanese-related sulfurtransferase